jgi:CBS domain containing-hemolysin-like protein
MSGSSEGDAGSVARAERDGQGVPAPGPLRPSYNHQQMPALLGLIAIIVLVLANGFFVSAEFALVAVRRSRLEQLAAEGRAGAQVARDLVGHLDRYIAACQLGITMASLGLGWIGEPALAAQLEPWLRPLGGRFAWATAHGIAIGVAFSLITAMHIVLGELAPKGLALQRPEGTTLWVARPLQWFYRVFRWPIGALNAVGNGVLRVFGMRAATGEDMVHSAEELRLLLQASQEAGEVEPSEARIANRAFQFADLTAGELLTPRTEIEAVPAGVTLPELMKRAASAAHSRLPVYEGSLDHIVGVLYLRDLFRLLLEPAAAERFEVRALMRPVPTVPASKRADELLDEMRAARQQLAVVVDEYGGTAGIITLHDLVEGLVGRIDEEPALAGGERPAPGPRAEPDGSQVFDGLTRLRDFEEVTGIEVSEEDRQAADTVGGLIMVRLGHLPRQGDEVEVGGRRLRVERLRRYRVAEARLLPAA